MNKFEKYGFSKYVLVPSVLVNNIGDLGLTRKEVVVLQSLLALCWGEKTTCHPSVKYLAKMLDYKVDKEGNCSSLKKVLKSLEVKGMISVRSRPNKSNVYDTSPLLTKCGQLETRLQNEASDDEDSDM